VQGRRQKWRNLIYHKRQQTEKGQPPPPLFSKTRLSAYTPRAISSTTTTFESLKVSSKVYRRMLTRAAFSYQERLPSMHLIMRLQVGELTTLIGLLLVGLLIRLVKISQPFVDNWSWRQTDVAMVAENFYRHGFNIFYPQINWAGAAPGYVGTEFPAVSFIASLLYLFFGVQDWIGRSISVLCFVVSIVPF
jgi:hypothetical protein